MSLLTPAHSRAASKRLATILLSKVSAVIRAAGRGEYCRLTDPW
jgi:hypothetical protein